MDFFLDFYKVILVDGIEKNNFLIFWVDYKRVWLFYERGDCVLIFKFIVI